MKKYMSLIGYIICFILSAFLLTTTFAGIKQSAYIGSVILLAILSIVFIILTILLYKVYRKNK